MDEIAADRKVSLKVRQWLDFAGLKWLALGLIFALLYGPLMPGLVSDWYGNETFSYGFLIPLITGYLVWERRARLKSISPQPVLWAAGPLFIALALGVLGQAIGDVFSVRVSMILTLASIIYLLLGREYFSALLFPIFYLALMIPVPYVLIKDLTYHLRYLDAAHAGTILAFLGIPVFVDAYFIHIPNMTLEVADVCSGVSSVFALFALGNIYAHFLPIRTSMKVLLVACTLPFAMIANLIRIVIISVLAYNFGSIVFQSTFHWLTGTTVFTIALVLLISTGELLRRNFPLARSNLQSSSAAVDAKPRGTGFSGWLPYGACILLLAVALTFANLQGDGQKVNLNGDLTVLASPNNAEVTQPKAPELYHDSNVDKSVSFVATGVESMPIEVFVGYRGEQSGGKRLGSPKINFPENWNSVWLRPANVQISGGTAIRGNWMLTRQGDLQRLVFYWYQIADDTFSGEFENRLRQFKRALLERRTDGAVVRIATPVVRGEMLQKAEERLAAAARKIYPEVVKVLPR